MKTILLWDGRFPNQPPLRLDLQDAVADACVRAGAAAYADPLQGGPSGQPLSGLAPVVVALSNGNSGGVTRVVLPLEVAQIAIAAGIASPIGGRVTALNTPAGGLLTEDGLPMLGDTDILQA